MKTIVVRNPGRAIALEKAGPNILASVEGGEELAAAVAEETSVTVEDLSEGDRAELEGSPEFITASPMPMRLIEPLPAEPADGPEAETQDANDQFLETVGGAKAAWGIIATGAAASQFTGRDVPVAVLDTGIDRNHPAFAGVNIVARNFTSAGDADLDGHGTHCAGTIFGRDVGGVRIGVARGVTQAFIAKVIPAESDALIDALNWVFGQGARVASMSLGYDFPGWVGELQTDRGIPEPAAVSMALRDFRANIASFDALMGLFRAQAMTGGGMVVVAASGNESERALTLPQKKYTISASPPSAAIGVIAVGAVRRTPGGLKVADFSNTAPQVAAPGVGILSAKKGGQALVAMNGTSMACPHVAGLAALYWDQAIHGAGGAPGADTIVARLIGRAQTTKLAPGFSRVDVGDGLAVAP
jgi:subtilisin family serine protease